MSLEFTFDQDVNTVFNLITDPDFIVERCVALGEVEADCDVEDYEDKTVVTIRRVVSRDLPAFLAKLFDTQQTLKMVETWNKDGENWQGEYRVDVEGQPVTVTAKFSLEAKGSGSLYRIQHKAKANIPLIGGKVEKFILGNTESGAGAELEYTQNALKK